MSAARHRTRAVHLRQKRAARRDAEARWRLTLLETPKLAFPYGITRAGLHITVDARPMWARPPSPRGSARRIKALRRQASRR